MTENVQPEVATLAGGCFWCIEAVFREVDGVESVQSGYTGGTTANPTYEQVSSGKTGHAEAVQITFDSRKVSYREILDIFFSVHDPTTLNRQGADVGTQYRSAIYYHTEQQKAVAEEVINELTKARVWKKPIVMEITAAGEFYPAEDYHRDYYIKHPEQAYCQIVIAPKVDKFRKQQAVRLKS
ncbi:MAG: peptide-methionine (S)-S-oxide reductase MsrA [Chloroflexota bacterium]